MSHATLNIDGMHCASCVARVEGALSGVAGVSSARANLATNQATVDFDEKQTAIDELLAAVKKTGYGAEPAAKDALWSREFSARESAEFRSWLRRLIVSAVLLAVLGAIHFFIRHAAPNPPRLALWLQFAVATVMWFYVGWPYLIGAIRRLRYLSANMDTLVTLGTGTAYGAGVWAFSHFVQGTTSTIGGGMSFMDAGMILTFITLGKTLEASAKGRTSAAVRQLLQLQPDTTTRMRGEKYETVPTSDVAAGDEILVRPGERIPLDGVVKSGHSEVDQSWLTGESMPVSKQPGAEVFAGTVNGGRSLAVVVKSTIADSAVTRIVELVRKTQESKADVQRLADRVVAYFVPAVLVVALVALVANGISAAVAVLVVACPCALGLATPTAVLVGSGRGATRGILIKEAHALEIATTITTVVLDKTGTVTSGELAVKEIVAATKSAALKKTAEDELLATAAAAERLSGHPVGKCIVAAAEARGLSIPKAGDLQVVEGAGIMARCRAGRVLVGNESLMQDHDVDVSSFTGRINTIRAAGQTPLLVALGRQFLGAIAVADVIAPHSREAIWQLKGLGLDILLVTGDHRVTAEAVGRDLGIHKIVAEVLPPQKQKIVEDLQSRGEIVAMVGDGINDAPALAAADLGIAIGSGADVAIESADVVLAGRDLRNVQQTIMLSRVTLRTIRQNLVWAFVYNVLLIPLAVGGVLPPVAAAAAMALSSVTVVANSLLLRYKKIT
jgi:Cu+-exporting ATPase